MNALQARKEIQAILNVTIDGNIGPRSMAALESLKNTADDAPWPIVGGGDTHNVFASSFADPADVKAFRACKATGKTDQECFEVGDNGIGKWGDDCREGAGPKCALPPEDWQAKFGTGDAARHAKVIVTANGRKVECQMDDTMPHKAHITNGAGIDLSPDAVEALGLRPPIMVRATWAWV